MDKELFRVEIVSTPNQVIIDTKESNYGKSFETDYYDYFLEVYASIMENVNIPVDFLISVNNQIYASGGDYVKRLNDCIQGDVLDIFQLTNEKKHKGYKVPISLLNEFLQSFDEYNPFIFFDNGIFLWEYYLEKVRFEEFNHLPKRMSSTFFFDNIDSCNYYITNHLNGIGQIKKIELVETKISFQGDMSIIDAIENSISRDELLETIRKYWRGEKSDNPVMEVIFQGSFKFIN